MTSVCVSYDRVVSARDTISNSGYEIKGLWQKKKKKKIELKLRIDSLHLTLFATDCQIPEFGNTVLNLIFSKVIVVQ